MKKIFIALAVMAALMFSVAPSQALNSMPDDVPGTNPLLPFFLVNKAGFSADTGLDTLFVIQEIGGGYTKAKTKGYVHCVIRNYKSVEVGDTTFPYTPYDVLAFSVRDILKNYVGVTQLPGLEITLNGVVYYTGYIDWENYNPYTASKTDKNLVAFMYIIDLANGWAAADTAPVFESASTADGYDIKQTQYYSSEVYGAYYLEPFDAAGLATTQARERGAGYFAGLTGYRASSFRLMPRYFLKDANAQTWVPIWSSCNKWNSTLEVFSYPITCYLFDSDENAISVPINIPYEVNWVDIRNLLPTAGAWAAVTGGWLDIPIPSNGRGCTPCNSSPYEPVSWLAWSYQTASSASIGANWSVLHAVHREAGTLEVCP